MRLALPLNSRIGQARALVKPRWNPLTARAVASGREMARFLGTSSPKIMVRPVASTSARAMEVERAATGDSPASVSGPTIRAAMAGSARNPMPRFVTVMPSCAPESCVDSVFIARSTPPERRSPVAAAASTSLRLTVISENSAATKAPQAAIRATPTRIDRTSISPTTSSHLHGPKAGVCHRARRSGRS
jgi:hypothetical protein